MSLSLKYYVTIGGVRGKTHVSTVPESPIITPPIIDSLPNSPITTPFDMIRSIQGDSFSESIMTKKPFTERFSSLTNMLSEGMIADSLWFLKEAALSETSGWAHIGAHFDISRTKYWIPETFFTMIETLRKGVISYPRIATLLEPHLPWDYFSKPTALIGRLSFDTTFLAAQSYSYGKALQAGVQFFSNGSPPLSLQKAAFLSLAGLQGLYSTAIHGYHLFQGTKLLSEMDEMQQKAVLKNRALHSIAQEKPCNAAIIDGMSSSWGRKVDDFPSPAAQLFYEKCNTESYRVTSDIDICTALETAEKHFGSPIDHLFFNGHADENRMTLNEKYDFHGPKYNNKAVKCMDRHLKQSGQIFMLGCNTATGNNFFTKQISEALPSREVTGIKAYLNPLVASQSFVNNKLSYHAFFPLNSKNEFVFGDSAITFKGGKEI